MRFWRRRVPGGTAEEPGELSPEMPETIERPPEISETVEPGSETAETLAEPSTASEPEAPRGGWLGRLRDGFVPAPAEPLSEKPETPEPPPEVPESVPEASETVEPASEAAETLAETPTASEPETPRGGWLGRLRAGLSRSSARLNQGINTIFLRRRLDEAALAELEELLIASDMGVGIAEEVADSLRRTRFNQEIAPEEVRAALAEQVIRLVEPVMKPLSLDPAKKPFVILVIGVNGSGKTTTIAKLARQYRDDGLEVVLAAGDTFRAAAVEQLEIWGERVGCRVVSRPPGADAAGLCYDALVSAREEGADVLLIDTAGRLHNKAHLMGELQKIVRVLKKVDAAAPHSVLLVLDATTGQNAHAQAEIFRDMVGVTGLVMTKLDGTAKGGVLVSLAEKYGIPIHFLGVGESAEDLRPFEARAYARGLVGLDA